MESESSQGSAPRHHKCAPGPPAATIIIRNLAGNANAKRLSRFILQAVEWQSDSDEGTQEDLKADEQAIGCHWMKVHSVPQGDELPFNQGLCDALSGGQTKFTLEKLASFGLPKLPTVFTWLVFLLMPETGLLFLPLGYFTIST